MCVCARVCVCVCVCVCVRSPIYFYIKLRSEPKKVLDICRADPKPGSKVIVFDNKGDLSDNQLWYEDCNGIVRSKLNDYAMDATGNTYNSKLHVEMLLMA